MRAQAGKTEKKKDGKQQEVFLGVKGNAQLLGMKGATVSGCEGCGEGRGGKTRECVRACVVCSSASSAAHSCWP